MIEPIEHGKHAGGRPPREFNRVEGAMLRLKGYSYRRIARHFGISKSLAQRELRSWVPTKTPTVPPEPIRSSAILPDTLEPMNQDMRPVDLAEEESTTLPPRTPGRICLLLQHESPAQTRARIANDYLRVAYQRG
jgi:hypothetical protein